MLKYRRLIFLPLMLLCAAVLYFGVFFPPVSVPQLVVTHDADGDGVYDLADLVDGARQSVAAGLTYKSAYYKGGYPPETEGVCTDLIWRAYRAAGWDLKALVDADIASDPAAYPRTNGTPDPNIDFRRVENLNIFFSRNAEVLTTTLVPRDAENLAQWQGGDIVVVDGHIGMLSNRRNRNGVPYVIHHPNGKPREENILELWAKTGRIDGHYRYLPEG
ncbi:MAG TPA: DUF1287 domain-containing protein [Oscillospiraceae bacterium]|nr:DUF1287 domain-containing protein [Oscillospiraceae bacterium]